MNHKKNSEKVCISFYETLQGGTGIPNIRWQGCERNYNILVMDFLGPSLADLFKICSGQFTMKTVLMLAEQLLDRIGKSNFYFKISPLDGDPLKVSQSCIFLVQRVTSSY